MVGFLKKTYKCSVFLLDFCSLYILLYRKIALFQTLYINCIVNFDHSKIDSFKMIHILILQFVYSIIYPNFTARYNLKINSNGTKVYNFGCISDILEMCKITNLGVSRAFNRIFNHQYDYYLICYAGTKFYGRNYCC